MIDVLILIAVLALAVLLCLFVMRVAPGVREAYEVQQAQERAMRLAKRELKENLRAMD